MKIAASLLFICFLACLPLLQSGCKKESKSLPVVTTLPVSEITTKSAVSGGTIVEDGGAEIILKGLVYSRDSLLSIYKHTGNIKMGGNSGSFVAPVTGLLPGFKYYIRAYATSGEGTGYGGQLHFITQLKPCPDTPTVTDIDGNVYNTVLIGGQCWMRENLKTTTYKGGSSIVYPGVNNADWQSNTTGAFAWHNNDVSWKHLYGALYNWHAVTNAEGLCPEGWRVPSYSDWAALTGYIGGTSAPSGNKLKSCLQEGSPLGGDCNTSTHPRWRSHNTHHGTDDFTFSALPGGGRFYDGTFNNFGDVGNWWSSDEHSSSSAWTRQLSYNNGSISVYYFNKRHGYSVRCLKN